MNTEPKIGETWELEDCDVRIKDVKIESLSVKKDVYSLIPYTVINYRVIGTGFQNTVRMDVFLKWFRKVEM